MTNEVMDDGTIIVSPPVDSGPKMWYYSTEIWTAIVTVLGFTAQTIWGWIVPAELQASFVVLLMAMIRSFKTSRPIAFTKAGLTPTVSA